METLYDLLVDLPPGAGVVTARTTYDADATRGTAFKTGNFLRTLGVREGVGVGIASAPEAKPFFSFLGAGLLGATARFDPESGDGLRAYVAPTADVEALDLPAGGQRVAWGAKPTNPRVEYFERDVWSENPAFPPVTFDGDTALLAADGETDTHGAFLDAVERSVGDCTGPVVVDAPLALPGVLVAAAAGLRAGEPVYIGARPDETDSGGLAGADADAADAVVVGTDDAAAIDPRKVEI